MLRSNLSTRPFYNVRAVRLLLGGLIGILLAVSALHLLWARDLSTRKVALTAQATQAKAEASRLRSEAQRMRAQINSQELEKLSAAAREVNTASDQRAFSWSSLLVQLERSLPANVRVTSIQPAYEEQNVVVSLHLQSRSDEDISNFMNALEKQGIFSDVWAVERQWGDDVIDAVVKGRFQPGGSTDAASSPIETAASLGGRSAR